MITLTRNLSSMRMGVIICYPVAVPVFKSDIIWLNLAIKLGILQSLQLYCLTTRIVVHGWWLDYLRSGAAKILKGFHAQPMWHAGDQPTYQTMNQFVEIEFNILKLIYIDFHITVFPTTDKKGSQLERFQFILMCYLCRHRWADIYYPKSQIRH